VAQVSSVEAGSLVEPGGPPAFGPRSLAAGEAGVLGNNTTRYVFPMGCPARTTRRPPRRHRAAAVSAHRATSVPSRQGDAACRHAHHGMRRVTRVPEETSTIRPFCVSQ
jgi:hypothetical protein